MKSVLRVVRMSSKTARAASPASLSPSNGTIPMSPRNLMPADTGSLQFAAEPADQKQRKHTKIAEKRPARMREGRRPVVFEHQMPEPGRAIAEHRRRYEPEPAS